LRPEATGFGGPHLAPGLVPPQYTHTPRMLSAIVLASIVILGTAGTMAVALAFSRAAGGWDRGD